MSDAFNIEPNTAGSGAPSPSTGDVTNASSASRAPAPGPIGEAALELARAAGLSFTVADLLVRRGYHEVAAVERWLEPKLAQLTPPHDMADLAAASQRIARAIKQRERIAVFGDYDCDGITACAIMTEVIGALGGDATPLLANRFAGGYGFSMLALERVKDTAATLLITCDCGSSDHERLDAARRAGIDVVVIDHHLVPEERLPVVAFLNPHRPECGFPFKGLASCGLALFVATALRKELGATLDVRAWLDLVAVGTIADVAPLTGDNRVLVRRGLEWLGQGHRIGLRALAINGAGGKQRAVSAEDVAFQIAPRINAPGRLGDPALALELLLATDATRAWELAGRIELETERRRDIQRRMTDEAFAEIERCGYDRDPAIVLASERWHPGVVGIVAGRIADKLSKPTVVVAIEAESGRGSARTPAGVRLYDALAVARDTLLGFGGHQAAAGVEVALGGVDRFRDAFREACRLQLADGAVPAPVTAGEVRLDRRDDPMQVVGDLERVEPCGEANPAAELFIEDVEVLAVRPIKTHLKLELKMGDRRVSAFAPQMASEEPPVGVRIDVVGRLRRDHWRGGEVPEILVDAILSPEPAA